MERLEQQLINHASEKPCLLMDSLNLYRFMEMNEWNVMPDTIKKVNQLQESYMFIHKLKHYEMYYNIGLVGKRLEEIEKLK